MHAGVRSLPFICLCPSIILEFALLNSLSADHAAVSAAHITCPHSSCLHFLPCLGAVHADVSMAFCSCTELCPNLTSDAAFAVPCHSCTPALCRQCFKTWCCDSSTEGTSRPDSLRARHAGSTPCKNEGQMPCRQCFEVWCQDGSPGGNCNPDPNQRRVTIMISDVCEPCSPPGNDHIDLQALTFLKVRCHAEASVIAAPARLSLGCSDCL